MKSSDGQPKVRSLIAIVAFQRSGAGKHGGTPRQQNRRDRRSAKADLREQR